MSLKDSFYQELMSDFTKEASFNREDIMEKLEQFSTEELEVLAAELDVLSNPPDLAAMSQMMPSYKDAIGGSAGSDDPVTEDPTTSGIVDVSGGVSSDEIIATENDEDAEKLAEGNKDEEKEDEEDKDEEDKKEEKEDKDEEKKDKKEAEEEDNGETKEAKEVAVESEEKLSASETLYALLKQGADIEEAIEKRAHEIAEEIVKEADMFADARMIGNRLAARLGKIGVAAHDFVEHFVNEVKTICSRTAESPSAAATKLEQATLAIKSQPTAAVGITSSNPAVGGSGATLAKKADEDMTLEDLESYASELVEQYDSIQKEAAEIIKYVSNEAMAKRYLDNLEHLAQEIETEYEKVAFDVFQNIEQFFVQAGQKAGLMGSKLYDYVRKNVEHVKDVAAKTGKPVTQVMQEGGQGGSTSGFTALNPATGQTVAPPQFMDRIQQSQENMAVQAKEELKELIKKAALS